MNLALLHCAAIGSLLIATMTRANELDQILIDGEDWEEVSNGHGFTEGPAVDPIGMLYFTDTFASKIHRLADNGDVEVFVDKSFRTNGLMFGPDGKLYGCQDGEQRIVAFDESGTPETIAENVRSNDLVIARDGSIYFTDPSNEQIWYLPAGGSPRVVDTGLEYANGLILSPDQKTLVVADMRDVHLWAYRIGSNGDLSDKQAKYTLMKPERKKDSGADGMTIDAQGRIYCTSHLGLQVFDADGELLGIIEKPQKQWLANVVFAGAELDTLYVTCRNKVYRRKLNARGIRYFEVREPAK